MNRTYYNVFITNKRVAIEPDDNTSYTDALVAQWNSLYPEECVTDYECYNSRRPDEELLVFVFRPTSHKTGVS